MPALHRRMSVVLTLLVAASAGCGGGGGLGPLGLSGAGGKPNATDAAYVRAMVPHEQDTGAIVALGRERALRKELRKVAATAGSDGKLANLNAIATDLRNRGIRPGRARVAPPAKRFDPRTLRDATSFDHEFLVQMIRQYQAAVGMAQVEQDLGGDGRIQALAAEIHRARSRDLEQLRRWLHTWYGEDTVPGFGGSAPSGPGQGEPDDGHGGGGGEPQI
jgi:uncharacterized protein (DUF305 family)